jgi:hypothetical protein
VLSATAMKAVAMPEKAQAPPRGAAFVALHKQVTESFTFHNLRAKRATVQQIQDSAARARRFTKMLERCTPSFRSIES